ncbi:hypothetical protein C8J55DRAFT_567627 [Lentinula edodes]|uniref:Uncharacterized protein n=1 Tax=Lentinula lateritia TaxID=40482 RepID=A0A9W8ZP50_9AGAR|nr:hypothetical protein C8J55DRAFT_567627 [Lentinula edodes]
MDKDYDEKEAVEALNRMRAICLGNEIRPHLSNFVQGEGWEDSTTIRKFEEPSCWRMAQVDANGVFEVIVHVQGVIEDKKLPPIRGELTKKKMHHIRQSITVSGLGSKAFGGDVDSVFDLYAFFARHIPGLKFDATKGTSERPMLEMSNRIFTPKVEAPNMNPAKVDKQMDENGVIERTNAMDAMFVYGEENIVLYGEEKTDASGRKKTVRISPQKLHVGDIVDIAFSMVAFGKGNELKARLLLRNITLLDATHTQKWLKQKAKNQFLSVKSQPMLRRRLEFDNDEDEEDARKRMRRMDIADTNEMQAES